MSSSKNGRRSDESLQIPSNAIYEDEDPSLERPSNSRHTDSPGLVRSSEESIASTSSLSSREAPPFRTKGIPRRSSETIYPQLPPEEFSDDIQKLIREADEAFQAVGNTLAEVRLERYSLSDEDTLPQAFTLEEPPQMSGSILERPGPLTPDMSPILQQFPVRLTPQSQTRFNTSPALPPPTRNTSVTKRKKSKKHLKSPKIKSPPKAVKARKPTPNRAAAARHAPRWTLTENVTELFTGRLFNKLEVDEMLTEAQLEEYKRRRMSTLKTQQEQEASEILKPSAADAKPSSEAAPSSEAKPSETKSSDTESLDTPIEPFHLEDLPSRIGSAGVKLTAETPVEEKKEVIVGPTFFYDDDPETQDFSVDRDELFLDEPSSNASNSTSGSSAKAASTRGSAYSSPPAKKSLKGLMAGRKQPPGLPSIPEANSAPRTPSVMDELFLDMQQKKQQLQLQDVVADSDYVYLRASPCTLTAPGFRHGPIRVAKADLIPEPTLGGADDGLDWTAFQMAILGGAGDWNSESDDTIHRRTVEELDDLVDWWESWHFEGSGSSHGGHGLGSLVTSEEAELLLLQTPPSPTSTLSGSGGEYYSSDISSYYSDIKQDNPYSAHHRWQTLRRQAAVQGLGLPGPKTSSFDDGSNRASSNNFNRDYHGRHSSKIYVPTTAALNPTTTTSAAMNPTTSAIPRSAFSTAGAGGMKPKPRPLPLELAGKPVDGDKLPPRFATDRRSLASLPQSPMLDLRVISDPEGDDVDVEVVPMGYNLGHDLGDFLKWEAEHVYAYSDVMM
ncbi:hypothetical protein SLS62_002994 [Diatrype stigma]|uniref:Uncharacterized protein n=1 Tax=Diatrype stigma TaxID=117547 RepID=A0AAN9YUU4_9PEZI